MLAKEICYSIKEKVHNYNLTDDAYITDSYIYYLMNVYRALLSRDNLTTDYYQMNCCVPVKCDSIKCKTDNGILLDSEEDIFYADVSELLNPNSITYVGSAAFSNRRGLRDSISIANFQEWLSIEESDWTRDYPIATFIRSFIDGDSNLKNILLLKNLPTNGVQRLCVNAAYANPFDNLCNDELDKFHYPMPTDKINKLELLVVKDIIENRYRGIGDYINDTADSIASQIKLGNSSMQNPK